MMGILVGTDGETLGIDVRLIRIELFAHNDMPGLHPLVRRVSQFPRNLGVLGSTEDLLGNVLIVHLTINVVPALHLRKNPHRHGVPGKRIKIDALLRRF